MSPARLHRLRLSLPFFACVGLALLAGLSARAAAKPLTREEQAGVERAIDKAVAFLKRSQSKSGAWQPYGGAGENPVGETLLPALALLESGAPATDPAVRKAADLVRGKAAKLHKTYEVSLAVLFFDRLGDPADEKLIRSLALRLVAGQCRTGGWCYPCPTLSAENEKAFAELLPRLQAEGAVGKELVVPKQFKLLTLAQPPAQRAWRDPLPIKASNQLFTGRTDNSNTQFALLALWAARRHGVPVGASLRLAVERFERSQNADGSWCYRFYLGGGPPEPRSRAMTTVGALALAIGHALDGPAAPRPQLTLGLAAVAREVGRPTGQWKRRVPMTDVYYLWSLERTGVLFDLPEIADRDWYRWGAEGLVTNQTERGDWGKWAPGPPNAYPTYGPVANTSFALLFLKRSHLSKDLTAKLPFKPEALNAGVLARVQGGDFPTRPVTPGGLPKKP
ncbi:MAG TPA: hypothetical protein VFE78_26995 [Gemmataceae bacterium]|jgi:hypothetical protein|nr:hypothetical protein [Gemmataceae bacterium]